MPKTAKTREETRLRAVLSAREKQFQIATAAFKQILSFDCARGSVFVTEVELVKKWALDALTSMENVQRSPKKRLKEPDSEALQAKYCAAKIAGTFLK